MCGVRIYICGPVTVSVWVCVVAPCHVAVSCVPYLCLHCSWSYMAVLVLINQHAMCIHMLQQCLDPDLIMCPQLCTAHVWLHPSMYQPCSEHQASASMIGTSARRNSKRASMQRVSTAVCGHAACNDTSVRAIFLNKCFCMHCTCHHLQSGRATA